VKIGSQDDAAFMYMTIDNISVVGGAILITKRAPRDLAKYAATFEQELRTAAARGNHGYGHVAVKYAEFLITYGHNLDRAVQLLEELVAQEPDNRRAREWLQRGLTSSGRLEEAARLAAFPMAPDDEIDPPSAVFLLPKQLRYPH
jgi:hypothetical protein